MENIEEGPCELVISGGDRAVDFQMSDHALDAVAFTVDASVPPDFGFAGGFWRDAAPDARVEQSGTYGVGVVTFVGKKIGGSLTSERDHIFERRAVRDFAGGEMEGKREALGVTETMNFTGEPAPRAAKSLFASPPFAPAAET